MDEFVQNHQKIVFETTLKALEKNGFTGILVSSKEEAAEKIMEIAKNCSTVGIAGTHTVRALGVLPKLEQAGKVMSDHWKFKPGTPEELECRKNQGRVDLFLISSNAVTMNGEIVNRDGCGNRVNAMTFGPGKVVIVIGKNKITPDLESALARIEAVAAPIRAMSLNRKTPCVKTGYCMDCDSPERICRITSIIHKRPLMTDITVIIIPEDLGY
ncbi:MAG: lactate utilization protein [Deltaproteobacteria bacterium]|nr:lactate utilization protein [Deltaproteobacteria bacterium]